MASRIISNASYSLNRYKLLLKHTDCYQRASHRHIYNTGKLCCTKKCAHILSVPKRTNRIFTSVWIDTCSFHSSVRLCESHILTVPPFAESVKEGDVRWEKAVGDSVAVDEVICEIETDKTSIPVPSPVNGVLEERFVEDGGTVQAGAKLGKINVTGGGAAAPAKPKVAEPVPPPSESESPLTQPASAPSSASSTGEKHKLIVPPFAESVKEGDVRWEKNVGDSVAVDEVVCLIETDKTSVPVPSPISGILEQHLVEDGQTVQSGMELGIIAPGGGAPSAPKKEAAAPSPPADQQPSISVPPPSTPPPSPSAPPPPPSGSPIKSAAIPVAAIKHAQALEAATVKVPPQDPTSEITGTRSEQRVKMNRMRQRIAQRLKDAQNTTAMLTTFNEVDMSYITAFRKANQEAFQKKHGVKLSFMSAFLKASAYALQEQPVVNAVIDETEIVYRDYIDISVAVATPKGLVVPVVRNVESMNFADVEKAIAALAEKARKGSLAIEDMDGGTFTISNGGVFGSLMGTPIINPPQSAILGMHGIFERPIALNGQVVIRPMMYIALTYDHRLIDGREAVLFLRKIKACVENPAVIVAGL